MKLKQKLDENEALMAYERKEIDLHTRIALPVNSFKHKVFLDSQKGKYLITTVGKLKFNEILPDTYQYVNDGGSENIEKATPDRYFVPMGTNIKEYIKELPISTPFGKKVLKKLIAQIFKRYKTSETSAMLDELKDLGFKYSTISGITFSLFDAITSSEKEKIIEESREKVDNIAKQYKRGLITENERYEKTIEVCYRSLV